MDTMYERCCGLDIHKKTIEACFRSGKKRIVSYRFSYRCVKLCLFEALYPAPSARAIWPHRKAP